jgi:hypothetical protein
MSDDKLNSLEEMDGKFVQNLVRNNKKIREDRAIAIAESAQMIFKREVEDLELEIKGLRRDRENMLDLSPTNADSLVLATDFDAKAFVKKDLELGVKIRNLEIKLDIARNRYNELFTNAVSAPASTSGPVTEEPPTGN